MCRSVRPPSGSVARFAARVSVGLGASGRSHLARHARRGRRVSGPHRVSAGGRRGCPPTDAASADSARHRADGGCARRKRWARRRRRCAAYRPRHRRCRRPARRARASGGFRRGGIRARLLSRVIARRAAARCLRGCLCRSRRWRPGAKPAAGWTACLSARRCPMLFRMGAGRYSAPSAFRDALCRSSVGISTDEWPSRIPSGRRVYVFDPRPWSAGDVQAVRREVRRWQSAF